MKPTLVLLILFVTGSVQAVESPAELTPLMVVPGDLVLQDDFSKPGPIQKSEWLKRQGTRWVMADGVLRGLPSSEEYQANKSHHRGLEARVSVPKTPAQFVAKFSFRFLDGQETAIVPFIEFGHHVCRVKFSRQGTSVLVDHETVQVASSKDFKYESGKWYHAIAELRGDEFVIQFAGGPSFYVQHDCLAKPTSSGGNGLGMAGPRGGRVEIDNVSIWEVQNETQASWKEKRRALPRFEPVPTGKVKKTAKPTDKPNR